MRIQIAAMQMVDHIAIGPRLCAANAIVQPPRYIAALFRRDKRNLLDTLRRGNLRPGIIAGEEEQDQDKPFPIGLS